MKVILVPVSNRPECAIALNQAFKLGKEINASIKGCHIRAHSDSIVSLPDDVNPNDVESVESGDDAKLLFAKLATNNKYRFSKKPKSKPVAMWYESIGYPEKIFSILGPVSDLAIVSRPSKKGKSKARSFMMSALMYSSKPVIILPQMAKPASFKRISIAWNQSSQAALAVTAAIPLLQMAKKVDIITNGIENRVGPKSSHLKKYLQSWGVKANHVMAEGKSDAQALLNGYHETKSDLLIMGGYSHSRFKQKIFGGVTKYMLTKADIPVFMLYSK